MKYKVSFYYDSDKRCFPVKKYIHRQPQKDKAKITKYINLLAESEGYLDEPFSKHIIGKIRELRVDFWYNHHRIFYFTFIDQNIVFLHAFLKNTDRTPEREIEIAKNNYLKFINQYNLYE